MMKKNRPSGSLDYRTGQVRLRMARYGQRVLAGSLGIQRAAMLHCLGPRDAVAAAKLARAATVQTGGGVVVVVRVTLLAPLLLVAHGRAHALGGGAAAAVLGVDGRIEINVEREDVEGEDEADGPLQRGARVVVGREGAGHEDYGEGDRQEDEDELDPEGDAEDSVGAVAF